ncbi:MAG: hypothetical protein AAF844_01545 [Pseudomonadota bacterium]
MLHDPRPPAAPDALPFARSSDAQEALLPRQFHLGQPHLTTAGLSYAWLLEECGHRHRWSIAESLRTRPGAIRDAAGRTVLTPVIAARVAGYPGAFRADDEVTLTFGLEPWVETGWRSEHALVGARGGSLTVELITSFAAVANDVAAPLAASTMPPHLSAADINDGPARRSRVLRARGRAAEAAAEVQDSASDPVLTVPALGGVLHDAAGLPSLAMMARLFDAAEAIAGNADRLDPIIAREFHLCGSIQEGDSAAITLAELPVTSIGSADGRTTLAIARRVSDGAVIALATTTRNR